MRPSRSELIARGMSMVPSIAQKVIGIVGAAAEYDDLKSERTAIRSYYINGANLKKTGIAMGHHKSYVCRLVKSGISQLKTTNKESINGTSSERRRPKGQEAQGPKADHHYLAQKPHQLDGHAQQDPAGPLAHPQGDHPGE
jgi:hypothetical protein